MKRKSNKKLLAVTTVLVSMFASEGLTFSPDEVMELIVNRVTENKKEETSDEITQPLRDVVSSKATLVVEYKESSVELKEICDKFAKDFSKIYNVNEEECSKVISKNINSILENDNDVESMMSVIEQAMASGELNGDSVVNIFGTSTGNIKYVNDFRETERGKVYEKYAYMYGLDPSFSLAKAKQESNLNHEGHLPGGDSFNGHAYGVSQIEDVLLNSRVTAYNFETGSNDVIQIVESYPSNKESGVIYLSVLDYEDNVRIGAAKLQEKLRTYNYNCPAAAQAYNYGGALGKALDRTSSRLGIDRKAIISDPTNTEWQKEVMELHKNPQSFGIEWPDGATYGDPHYPNHVFQYVSSPILKFKKADGERIYVNSFNQATIRLNENEIKEDFNTLKDCQAKINDYQNSMADGNILKKQLKGE